MKKISPSKKNKLKRSILRFSCGNSLTTDKIIEDIASGKIKTYGSEYVYQKLNIKLSK